MIPFLRFSEPHVWTNDKPWTALRWLLIVSKLLAWAFILGLALGVFVGAFRLGLALFTK
jgi:hypothetical protein